MPKYLHIELRPGEDLPSGGGTYIYVYIHMHIRLYDIVIFPAVIVLTRVSGGTKKTFLVF